MNLYERDQERAAAEEAIDALCTGFQAGGVELGGLLLLNGRAGLGKTALLQEIRRIAAQRPGTTVLFARGAEQQRQVPFYVIRQLLQPQLAKMSDEQRHAIFGNWYDIAAPAMGLAKPDPAAASDPQGVHDALMWVVTQLAVNQAPMVLVIDDLHWADQETVHWLGAFAARVRELPVLVVLAYRAEELPAHGGALDFLSDGRNGGREIRLHALSPDSVTSLVREVFGEDADEEFCAACWETADGNPYETVEMLHRVHDQNIEPVADSIPLLAPLAAAGKGPALYRRLENLGTKAFHFAWAVAVLGTKIDISVACRIANMPPSEAAPIINQLRDERILTGGPVLEFVHPTIATAAYHAVPRAMRTAMHGVAAQALLDSGAGLAAAARHLLEVHPDEDLELVRQLRGAAGEFLAMGAPDMARRCLERALSEPPADEDRAMILYELGRATQLIDPAKTVNHMRNALSAVPGLDTEHRVWATQRLAQALAHLNQVAEAAHVVAEEAASTPEGPHRMRLLAAHFMWCAFRGDEDDAEARSMRLADLARGRAGKDEWERAVLVLRAWDLTLRGAPTDEVLAHADRGLVGGRLADGLGWTNDFWGFELPTILGLTFAFSDRLDLAADLFNSAASEFEAAGWSGGQLAFATVMQGLVAHRWGQLGEAERLLRDGLKRSDRIGPGTPLQWDAVGTLIDNLIAQGRVDEALALAEKYRFAPPFPTSMVLPDAPTLYGRLLRLQGRESEAVKQLESVGRQLEQRGQLNPVWAPWAAELALTVVGREPGRARELTGQALRHATSFGTRSAVGVALRYCALVAPPEEAVDLLRRAVDHLSQAPTAFEYAVALVDLGSVLRRLSRFQEAAEPLYLGQDLATQCGSVGLANRARQELAASGLRPYRTRGVSPEPLSELERRVAQLAVRNFPTARIAGELGISVSSAAQLLASAHRKAGTGPAGLKVALEGAGELLAGE